MPLARAGRRRGVFGGASLLAVLAVCGVAAVVDGAPLKWDLEAYEKCHGFSLGPREFSGIAYSPKDNLIWAASSGAGAAAGLHGFDLHGALRRSLHATTGERLRGISWLHGDTVALTLPDEQSIGFASLDAHKDRLEMQHVPFRLNTVTLQDKVSYNAEHKLLLVTDLGTDNQARLSMVLPNGLVRHATDQSIDATNITDIYYATQPHKLYALSGEGQELLEVGPGGKVAGRLSLSQHTDHPVGVTFSPDGGMMMVLDSNGQVHLFSSVGCTFDAGASGSHRSLLQTSRRFLGVPYTDAQRQSMGLKSGEEELRGSAGNAEDAEGDDMLLRAEQHARPGLNRLSARDRDSVHVEQMQMAKELSSQNDVYLYYARLPVKRRGYLEAFTLCQAENLTSIASDSGGGFQGMAYSDTSKTLWTTATGPPALLAEYSISGTPMRNISMSPWTNLPPGDVTHEGGNHFIVMDSDHGFTRWTASSSRPKASRLSIQMPGLFAQSELRGLTWDDEVGRLFVAQKSPPAVWSIAENSPPVLLFTGIDLPISDISGMSHNRVTNTLLLVSEASGLVLETSVTGDIVGVMETPPSLIPGEPQLLAVAGGGKVMFLLSQSGILKIYSTAKC